MRILYVTTEISWPLSFGGEIRKWNLLQGLLQTGCTDALIFRTTGGQLPPTAFTGCQRTIELPKEYSELHPKHRRLYQSTLGRGLLTLSSRLPLEHRGGGRRKLRRELSGLLDFAEYDLVWFAAARTAGYFNDLGRAATVLDGDDFNYIRNLGLLRSSRWYDAKIWDYLEVAKMWWCERRYHRRFSYVLRCSEEDRVLYPAPNVAVIPNGATVPEQVARVPEKRVLFVGHLGYEPNRRGAEWFLEHVWPAVRNAVPGALLEIAGREPPAEIAKANGEHGVVVHGFVEDLTPLYERAALSVVPLFAGGGTRLKILESLGRAVPVVSTTVGAHGIAADVRHGLERADSARAFAAACIASLENLTGEAQFRARVGRELVLQRYDWAAIQGQVAGLARRAASGSVHSSHEGRLVRARK